MLVAVSFEDLMHKYRALSASLIFASLPLVSACADNDTSVYVAGILAPKAPACEYKADPSAAQLLGGLLDVAFRQSYDSVVLIGNQMAPRGNKDQLRTETMGIEIRGAEVRLTDAQEDVLDEFSVPAGGFVQSNDADAPGFGSAQVTLVPASRGAALYDELSRSRGEIRKLVANIRVFGTTLGGIDVTSAEYKFTIDVCYGCSVFYPSDAMVGGKCAIIAEAPKEGQCNVGQDSAIDCRTCSQVSDVCNDPSFQL